MIVSFSGIDGAGKSTQIGALEAWLRRSGGRVNLLTFWDDVVAFPRFREFMSQAAFHGDQGIGTPEKPLHRRDKNVTAWPVTILRFCVYLVDAVSLSRKMRRIRRSETDVVIFDRYIYDELANLPLNRWPTRAFVQFALKLTPKPDIAYLIDADPAAARARKPEYPLEFLYHNREAYLSLSRVIPELTIIEPLSAADMEMKVRQVFLQRLSGPQERFSRLAVLP